MHLWLGHVAFHRPLLFHHPNLVKSQEDQEGDTTDSRLLTCSTDYSFQPALQKRENCLLFCHIVLGADVLMVNYYFFLSKYSELYDLPTLSTRTK